MNILLAPGAQSNMVDKRRRTPLFCTCDYDRETWRRQVPPLNILLESKVSISRFRRMAILIYLARMKRDSDMTSVLGVIEDCSLYKLRFITKGVAKILENN